MSEKTCKIVPRDRLPRGYDCTNHGVTSVAILFRSAADAAAYQADHPADPKLAILVLDESVVCGSPYMKTKVAGEKRRSMFGGNFIWTSDSRFRTEVSERPIPVHDRVEA